MIMKVLIECVDWCLQIARFKGDSRKWLFVEMTRDRNSDDFDGKWSKDTPVKAKLCPATGHFFT